MKTTLFAAILMSSSQTLEFALMSAANQQALSIYEEGGRKAAVGEVAAIEERATEQTKKAVPIAGTAF